MKFKTTVAGKEISFEYTVDPGGYHHVVCEQLGIQSHGGAKDLVMRDFYNKVAVQKGRAQAKPVAPKLMRRR